MIVDLGNITGKVILFGGVYSNLQAFESLIAIAKQMNIPFSNMISTGDLIGYCAQPEEVVNLMRDHEIKSIAGNVEVQLREDKEDCGCEFQPDSTCDILSNNWYAYARNKISVSTKQWLETLPLHFTFQFSDKQCFVLHGSYTNISEFIFQSTDWKVKEKNFIQTNADIIIGGHSGLPFIEQNDTKTWINPGVIGMPANDGNPSVWYMVMEEVEGEIKITPYALEYDNHSASLLMTKNKLPNEYAKTLLTGIWDNCDILPDIETALQGKPIQF